MRSVDFWKSKMTEQAKDEFIQELSDDQLVILTKATKWYLWQDADAGGHHLKNGEYGVCQRLAEELTKEAVSRKLDVA